MEEKTWKRIVKGEMLPTNSIIRPIDGGLPNIAGSCVTVGQDCYYLSVDDAYELLKDLPLETEAEAKERNEATIIKKLIGLVKETEFLSEENRTSLLDWLEKQGEQNPAEVEPKFKIGDWIIDVQGVSADQIIGYEDDSYHIKTSCSKFYLPMKLAEKNYRLWTIKDAKDGDVLATKTGGVFIYKELLYDKPFAYCGVDKFGVFKDCNCGNGLDWTPYLSDVTPATKEQREQLEKAIADAGYVWFSGKKELKKIEQNPAWSEEDEVKMKELISYLVKKKSRETDGYVIFLKSIKFRLLSPSMREFDKEEGSIIDHLIAICDDALCYDTFAGCSKKDIEKYKSFLTNLKFGINPQPQTTWKPSDEQMKVLDVAIKSSHLTTAEYNGLVKLREQLKSL